jgi:hypothetical protein
MGVTKGAALWQYALATRVGIGATSATANGLAQYASGQPVRPTSILGSGLIGATAAGGGFIWNISANAVGSVGITGIENVIYNENKGLGGSFLSSGASGSIGYGVGKSINGAIWRIRPARIDALLWSNAISAGSQEGMLLMREKIKEKEQNR